MTFYERLLSLVSEKAVTKNKVTQDLGLSKNAFVDWEKRGNVPNGEVVAKLAAYFSTTTDYLLGKTDNPNPPDDKEINDNDIYIIPYVLAGFNSQNAQK